MGSYHKLYNFYKERDELPTKRLAVGNRLAREDIALENLEHVTKVSNISGNWRTDNIGKIYTQISINLRSSKE